MFAERWSPNELTTAGYVDKAGKGVVREQPSATAMKEAAQLARLLSEIRGDSSPAFVGTTLDVGMTKMDMPAEGGLHYQSSSEPSGLYRVEYVSGLDAGGRRDLVLNLDMNEPRANCVTFDMLGKAALHAGWSDYSYHAVPATYGHEIDLHRKADRALFRAFGAGEFDYNASGEHHPYLPMKDGQPDWLAECVKSLVIATNVVMP